MRLTRIRTEVRSQRYGIAIGAVALLVALGAPAQALEGAASATNSVARALNIAKKADKRSRQALSLAKKVSAKRGPQGEPGLQGSNGDTGAQGAQGQQGPQGPPGSDAQFNGAAAGGSLTGTYPNPLLGDGVVDTDHLAGDAVTSSIIATDAVGNLELQPGAVTSGNLAFWAVTSDKIQDGHVRAADLGTINIRSSTISVPDGGTPSNGNWNTATNFAQCLQGEVRIGGGAQWDLTTSVLNKELLIVDSYPIANNAWQATGGNDTDTAENLKVHVICLGV